MNLTHKKIALIAPKFWRNSFDISFWNFYLPLTKICNVKFIDITTDTKVRVEAIHKEWKPDLYLSIYTGDYVKFPNEKEIFEFLKNVETPRCNWFCDDAWRFEDFSSSIAEHLDYAVTTEPSIYPKYENLVECFLYPFPASVDIFNLEIPYNKMFTTTGVKYPSRQEYLDFLSKNGVKVHTNNSILGIDQYSQLINSAPYSICFSHNPNGNINQIKARPSEVMVSNSFPIIEYSKEAERLFTSGQNCLFFATKEGLLELLQSLEANKANYFHLIEKKQKSSKYFSSNHILRSLLLNIFK